MATSLCGCVALVGCARMNEGDRILRDLRADGLLVESKLRDDPKPRDGFGSQYASAAVLPTDGDITINQLLAIADERNPQLAAARMRTGMAGAEAWQASLYPNPTAGVESENVRPGHGGFGVSETTLRLSQPIIISDRRDAAIAAGDANRDAQQWRYEQVRRNVHGRIRKETATIVSLREAKALHNQLLELAQQMSGIAETRFEARATPQSDVIRAQIETSRIELSIERIDGEIATAAARLEALLGGERVEWSRIANATNTIQVDDQSSSLDEFQQQVRINHPAVLAANSDVVAAEQRVREQRALRIPDVTGSVGLGFDHADDESFVEFGVGLPLPIFDNNDGNILAARFDVMRARRDAESIANDLAAEIADAYHRAVSAQRRLRVFDDTLLNAASQAQEQSVAGYQAGRLSFLDMLDSQRTVVEASVTRSDLSQMLSVALADLAGLLGSPMDEPIDLDKGLEQ